MSYATPFFITCFDIFKDRVAGMIYSLLQFVPKKQKSYLWNDIIPQNKNAAIKLSSILFIYVLAIEQFEIAYL